MMVPPEISFRNMDSTPEMDTEVRERISKLEEIYDRITSCKVVVEAPEKELPTSEPFHCKIYLAIPRHDIVVDRDPGDVTTHQKDVYAAIHDSFQAAERQLKKTVNLMRGQTKSHEPPPHGVVKFLKPEEEYGFIETPDRREVYFHANSVSQIAFDDLRQGQQVRYHEEMGDEGPQATVVVPVGRHHQFEDLDVDI